MIFWILSSILSSFSTIFWKKSLSHNCCSSLFSIFGFSWFIFLGLYFLFNKNYDFSWFNQNILYITFLVIIIQFVTSRIWQYSYKNEKISTLTPYENINKIISIVLAFIIFWKISYLSFMLTLFWWIILILFSIDFKNLKFPKVIKIFTFQQILISINILIIWYILKQITSIDYYLLSNLIYLMFILLVIVLKKEYLWIKNLNKDFYKNRLISSFFWSISAIIQLILISSLWISVTILFSYLYIWFILVLSYIFLNDIPTRKNIILTIILSIIVWLWYYFK